MKMKAHLETHFANENMFLKSEKFMDAPSSGVLEPGQHTNLTNIHGQLMLTSSTFSHHYEIFNDENNDGPFAK